MSKKQSNANRKCSAVLAAGAGAAICLTAGSGALAATGDVSVSNGGNNAFGLASGPTYAGTIQPLKLFSSKINATVGAIISTFLGSYNGGIAFPGLAGVVGNGAGMSHFPAGVTVSGSLGNFYQFFLPSR